MIKAKQSSSRFIIHCLLNCLCEGRISEWGFQTSPKIKNKTKTSSLSRETPEKTVFFSSLLETTITVKDFIPAKAGRTNCHLFFVFFLLFNSFSDFFLSFPQSVEELFSGRWRDGGWEPPARKQLRSLRSRTPPPPPPRIKVSVNNMLLEKLGAIFLFTTCLFCSGLL